MQPGRECWTPRLSRLESILPIFQASPCCVNKHRWTLLCAILRCSAKLSSLASVGGGSGPIRLLVLSTLVGLMLSGFWGDSMCSVWGFFSPWPYFSDKCAILWGFECTGVCVCVPGAFYVQRHRGCQAAALSCAWKQNVLVYQRWTISITETQRNSDRRVAWANRPAVGLSRQLIPANTPGDLVVLCSDLQGAGEENGLSSLGCRGHKGAGLNPPCLRIVSSSWKRNEWAMGQPSTSVDRSCLIPFLPLGLTSALLALSSRYLPERTL